MVEIAIIGGTGIYDPGMLKDARTSTETTPFGNVDVLVGKYEGLEIAFLPRHGQQHSVPPHLINYRANIMALKQLGVRSIIATAAVGSLHFEFKPGHYVLVDQFLDFTKSRPQTFYDGGPEGVIHCDMTVPYCEEVRGALMKAGESMEIELHNGGVYVCTEGPRFETAAEIRMYKDMGGQLVGMTSVPEVVLARELGICYATVCIVTNFAAGICPERLTHSEVVDMMRKNTDQVRSLIMGSLRHIPRDKKCSCNQILGETGVLK
ncbi:MAG: S-methyl-5'-thioadenosine phosphorylase [Syntrophomonadaceae bacterium]